MAIFNFDKWWLEHVGPEDNVMDKVYKDFAKEAIDAAIEFYGLNARVREEMENDSIDLDTLDLSDVLG